VSTSQAQFPHHLIVACAWLLERFFPRSQTASNFEGPGFAALQARSYNHVDDFRDQERDRPAEFLRAIRVATEGEGMRKKKALLEKYL
jgi:hypothetical protein